MSFYDRLVQEAVRAKLNNWQPPQGLAGPFCAHFISAMMIKAGWNKYIAIPGWAPYLYTQGIKITESFPGCLVFFQKTYIAPGGSDKTHVGIFVYGKGAGMAPSVAHYSFSRKKVCIDPLSSWPQYQFECFHKLNNPAGEDGPKYSLLKFCYHPRAKRPTITGMGETKEEQEIVRDIMNLILTVRTSDGSFLSMDSHPFEEDPHLTIDMPGTKISAPVKAIEWYIKYLKQ